MEEKNNDEKLEYLEREEIKTMQKDLGKLREEEAKKERERIAKLKTEEEAKKERARQELAKKEALEREKAEEEARRKEEKLRRLGEEKERREKLAGKESLEKERLKIEELRKKIQESQIKEEEERRRFLERVEAKAEEEAEAPPPTPPHPLGETPAPGEVRLGRRPEGAAPAAPVKIRKPLFRRPSFAEKVWIRVIISLLFFAILAGILTFGYWLLMIRGKPVTEEKIEEKIEKKIEEEIEKEIEKEEIIVPTALISTERTQTLEIADLSQIFTQDLGEDQFTRIVIKNTEENKILGLKEFFESFGINPPENFYDKIGNDFTLFIYSSGGVNRLGFVSEVKQKEGLFDLLSSWEPNMERDFESFFGLMGKDKPALVPYFRSGNYEETALRFQTFTRQDLGIVYSLFNDYFIFTSSWKSMGKILDRLREVQNSPLSLASPTNGAEFILERLTLEQKIGQLFLIGIEGKTLTPETEKLIKTVRPGGILLLKKNIENAAQIKKLIQDLQKISLTDTGLPLLISVDQEGGIVDRIEFAEEKTAPSKIKSAGQAYEVGSRKGEELKGLGINLNLAPVLDLTQPGDFLFERSFQKGPEETGNLAKALVSGQKKAGILTTIKHFPGYGGISFNPEEKLATSEKIPEISQFQRAIEAGPALVMTSNVVYSEIDPELPFTFLPKGIQFLEESLGNDYLIISDDLAQNSLLNKFSLKEVVTLPIRAGVDILLFSGWRTSIDKAIQAFYMAAQDKNISQERIDESVLKIIRLKKNSL